MPLTSSMEDYLEAVLIVAKKQIEVRSVDIARQLNVSKPSVWRAMTVLKDGGFLNICFHAGILDDLAMHFMFILHFQFTSPSILRIYARFIMA